MRRSFQLGLGLLSAVLGITGCGGDPQTARKLPGGGAAGMQATAGTFGNATAGTFGNGMGGMSSAGIGAAGVAGTDNSCASVRVNASRRDCKGRIVRSMA